MASMTATNELQDVKKEKILEAAYQRFLHYGYSKTTMNEIAGDLSMSKALLYYYFPDKSQLYVDVMHMVAADYMKTLSGRNNSYTGLKDAFEFQVDSQHNFILKNYNLFDFFRLNEQNLPDQIWQIVEQVQRSEKQTLVNAIMAEVAKGSIKPVENPGEVVELLSDALHGVRVNSLTHKKTMFPGREHLDELRKKRLLMCGIFISALTY